MSADRKRVADCIFCRIIAGEVPSSKVYEDDEVLAFVDINPVSKGHTLVVLKDHYEGQFDTPRDLIGVLAERVQLVAGAVRSATCADGLNIFQNNGAAAGQVVGHIHYHIVPRHEGDKAFAPWRHLRYEDGEAQTFAERIAESVSG